MSASCSAAVVLLYYYCTHMVGSWVVDGKASLLLSAVELYDFTHMVGDEMIRALLKLLLQ